MQYGSTKRNKKITWGILALHMCRVLALRIYNAGETKARRRSVPRIYALELQHASALA